LVYIVNIDSKINLSIFLEDCIMSETRYVSAREAARELGVTLATLYTYVSRGLIRSESSGARRRTRRYRWEDVQKWKQRKEARNNPTKISENALHWGMPVMESALTLIAGGQLYYRGHDATVLAQHHSVEQVAALLWTGNMEDATALFSGELEGISPLGRKLPAYLHDFMPVERMQIILPLLAASDIAAYDLRPAAVAQTGARILRLLVLIATEAGRERQSLAHTLQSAWTPDHPEALPLLSTALILCADHELNVSTFTARCVASAGSTPYNVVCAGLAALQGPKHGGMTERVEAFLREAGSPEGVRAAMAGRLKRGEDIPGLGHRLYPDGDPRGRLLYTRLHQTYPGHPALVLGDVVLRAVHGLLGEPNIDFGLALLARILNLPPGAAMTLFALGRSIGWIGHAIEQYETGQLIRPRARYIGQQPAD
jgi:citrate synthase